MLSSMKRPSTAIMIAWAALVAGCQKEVSQTRLPNFCVQQSRWKDLLLTMQGFAIAGGMELHGGIETGPNRKPLFNAYVSRGYSYWFGDDFDLWIVSNPFKDGEMTYNGIAKKPWLPRDTETAGTLLKAIEPLQCRTSANGS